MDASVECRQEEMSSGETKEKEKEKGDDMSLLVDFTGANLNLDLLQKSNQFHETLGSESENSLIPETKSIIHGQDPGAEDLLNSENTTTDYYWLLSPPPNSEPSPEMEDQKTLTSYNLISNGQSTSPESKLENPPADKLPASSDGVIKSSGGSNSIRRPSPSRKAASIGSRSGTPTTRVTVPSTTKPSRSSTPTSRPTVATVKPVAPARSSSRSSTPTPRPSILAAASKSTSRSSTSTPRPSIIATSKLTSRSSTPTQRPSNPSGGRSSSVTKSRAPTLKNPTSSSVKSKPEAPPSIKKSLPERPVSASKGRPGLTSVKLPATETNSKTIPKRTSSSPCRGHMSNGGANYSVKYGLTKSRGYSNGNDDVNPVLMGTKMVERVVNMRKLAPPREEHYENKSGKLSVSQDNAGFGRTLSKKSFDMALRHLDIRRSMPGNMRAMITKVPASSVFSVRSESTKTHPISASDSPLATSRSASSSDCL